MRKSKLFIISAILVCAVSSLFLSGCPKESKPEYYTFEDLRRGLGQEEFGFANRDKPIYAKVDLGYFPYCSANRAKAHSVIPRMFFNPQAYRIKQFNMVNRWRDSDYHEFDWDRFWSEGGVRGDLIFLRANGKGPALIKLVSGWTHVAIVDDVDGQKVFESMPDDGVQTNHAPTSWGKNTTYFSCKRIRTINYEQIEKALYLAKKDYTGLPYFPEVDNSLDRITFVARWSDIDRMDSMYCSKLVYHTFKDYVNLNTNNTEVFNLQLQNRAWGAPAFSWMGVSPDDIYYSEYLDHDFCYSENVNWL